MVQANFDLNKPNGTNAIPGPLFIGTESTNAPVEHVRLLRDNQIADTSAVNIFSSGVLGLNNHREVVGDLNGTGSIDLGSGRLGAGGAQASNLFQGTITGAGGEFDKVGTAPPRILARAL